MSTENLISWLAEDQQQGGLWPEGDKGVGTIVGMKFEMGTSFQEVPKYTTKTPTLVQILAIQPAGTTDQNDIIFDLCSGGDAARMVPSQDGVNPSQVGHLLIKAPGTQTAGLSQGSNLAARFAHLQKVALGDNKAAMIALKQNGNLLVGNLVEFVSIPQPKRDNLKVNRPTDPGKTNKGGDGRILLINKIISGPLAGYAPQVSGVPTFVVAPGAPAPAPFSIPTAAPVAMAFGQPQAAPMAFQIPGAPTTPLMAPSPFPAAPAAPPMAFPPTAPFPMAAPAPIPVPQPAPAPAPAPAPVAAPQAPVSAQDQQLTDYVGGLLRQALAGNPAGIMYKDLPGTLKGLVPAGDPGLLGAVLQRVVNQDFLRTNAGWNFDGAVVKL
jgi:hypothetical protein